MDESKSTHGHLPPVSAGPLPPLPLRVRDILVEVANSWHAEDCKFAPGQPPPSADAMNECFRLVQDPHATLDEGFRTQWTPRIGFGASRANALKPLLAVPEFTLGHVVRLAVLLGIVYRDPRTGKVTSASNLLDLAKLFQRTRGATFGLREVTAEAVQIGMLPEAISMDFFFTWSRPQGWTDDEVGPYFLEHADLLEMALGGREAPAGIAGERACHNALLILTKLAEPPDTLHAPLWNIALGSSKIERPLAQRCLNKVSGVDARILAALADKSSDVRKHATEWLANRRDMAAVAPLRVAARREKSDKVKATMMEALEALGASVDEFLDRPGLLKEAAKGLSKGVPTALEWFAFDRLPEVRWVDNQQPVDQSILTWWLVQTHKLRSPEPSPFLRRYASLLVPADARALGRFTLEAWIAHDTQPSFAPGMSRFMGSAIEHKGVLAVAGAMAGSSAATLVSQYLKDWYGTRAAQCKALLHMLSWVEDRSAIQVLLRTATRFRTPGIRKVAEECVQEMARRRGWTVDDLADRTIPTAELDDQGNLELSYGPRSFTARLSDDMKLTLLSPEGKTSSKLPEPRVDDDDALAKEAKNRFSQANKQLKVVVQQQRERLYEAMCTDRRWTFADWETYLARHPIVGRLCQRIVWMAALSEDRSQTFRPLGDGTLTGPDDGTVTIDANALVRIAHPLLLPDAELASWRTHLVDYEVQPLINQLGRMPYRLATPGASELSDFGGHTIEAFKLRGRATKLGYTRGPTGDGGWFYTYERHFPSSAITAELEFSGNGLPEVNENVAIIAMHFQRRGDTSEEPSDLPLAEVPPVLISECWNDLREIASEGTGFDPIWEKRLR